MGADITQFFQGFGMGAKGAQGPLLPGQEFGRTVGAGVSTLGTIAVPLAETLSTLQSLKGQSDSADFNRQVAIQNAQLTSSQTEAQLQTEDRNRRLRMGAARAQAGSSGLALTGSALDIMQSSAMQEELNLLTIKSEGLLREQNFLTEASIQGSKASQARGQMLPTVASGIGKGAAALTKARTRGFF